MSLRVLQVASFLGNIGDNANHAGFRPWFEEIAGTSVTWDNFEIRDVYRKLKCFDVSFSDLANRYDLLVVGGGNYFELWDSSSPTGTSFSITDEALEHLTVPVFFNALGVDAGQGVPDQARRRFQAFLGKLLASDRILVSVRNDGSWSTLNENAGPLSLGGVLRIPDAGFFASYGGPDKPQHRVRSGPVIGINLAGDMLEGRFPGDGRKAYEEFLLEFADLVGRAADRWPSGRFVLFPHIFRDLQIIADLLEMLPDAIRRERCRVAPYDSGSEAASEIFGAYSGCDIIFGMRFHANVVPIGLGIPVAGLVCYSQVDYLYRELECPSRAVDVRERGFADVLLSFAVEAIERPDVALREMQALRERVKRQRQMAEHDLAQWLARQGYRRSDRAQS